MLYRMIISGVFAASLVAMVAYPTFVIAEAHTTEDEDDDGVPLAPVGSLGAGVAGLGAAGTGAAVVGGALALGVAAAALSDGDSDGGSGTPATTTATQ